ncbi:hypothetical protein MACA111363_12175 [Macrococcoides canis]|uniref:Uncharacterized protein n=1 Tax=Macrococcoides canis TaxID=1855823 RepID=A0A1W7AE84_9STAP|nr:hypothetical protein [Macrococcus canis]ARQ07907.1 hypothetical protein MCCS_23270 [Macrococcus canis]UJS27595.1 hypothetical protein L2Z53_10740 [Macrococcus canis]
MHKYIDEQDKKKTLDEINAEIEAELQKEDTQNINEKKSNKTIFSVAGIITFLILARLIYHIIQYYFV